MDTYFARCGWLKLNDPIYVAYHDEEWGKPLQACRMVNDHENSCGCK